MGRFNDRIGARFALDSPDPIFLTLVEKYDNRACGQPCLPGSLPDASGICLFPQQVASSEPPMPVAAAPSSEQASRDIGATSKGTDPVPVPVAVTHDQKVAALALLKGQSGEPPTDHILPSPLPVLVAGAPDNGGAHAGQLDPSSVGATTPARVAVQPLPEPRTLAKSGGAAPVGTTTWTTEVSPTASQSATSVASLGSSDSSNNASSPAKAPATTIAVLTPTKPVKRQRKSSGWGNAAYGIGIKSSRPFYVVRRSSGGGDAIAQVFRALVGGLF
jgi:hypothetical protein